MNTVQLFNHPEFRQVRFVEIDGKPFAVGVDVSRALEYSNPSKAIIDHCKGITKLGIPSHGGVQETNVIPEGDIYRLVVKAADQSRNPEIKAKAERFESWIFDEVLPSIRKHGAYMTPQTLEAALNNPDTLITVLNRLKQEQEERAKLQAQIEADRPKVLFADSLSVSQDSILVADLAKLLKQNGIDMGEVRLFKWLRNEGYLIKSGSEYNMPTQRSMELKIMEIKVGYRGSSDGTTKITRTPKITGKGQIYFINKFKKLAQAN
ncbi:hypothetical protein JCM16163A_41490 [Paenibacillus sp. YK5]